MERKTSKKDKKTKEVKQKSEKKQKNRRKEKKHLTKRYRDDNCTRRRDECEDESEDPDENIPSYKYWKRYVKERDETISSILEKTLLDVFVQIENKKRKERTKNIRIPVPKRHEKKEKKKTNEEKELLSINEQIDVVSEALVTVSLYNIIIEEMYSSMMVRSSLIKISKSGDSADIDTAAKTTELKPESKSRKKTMQENNAKITKDKSKSGLNSIYPMNLPPIWFQKMQYVVEFLNGNDNGIQKVRNIDDIACILKTSVYVFTCSSRKLNQYIELLYQSRKEERNLLQTIADLNEYFCNKKEHEKAALEKKKKLNTESIETKSKKVSKKKRVPTNKKTDRKVSQATRKFPSTPKTMVENSTPLISTPSLQYSASYLRSIKQNESFSSENDSKASSKDDDKALSYQVKQKIFKVVFHKGIKMNENDGQNSSNSSLDLYSITDTLLKLRTHEIRPKTPDSVDTDVEVEKIHNKYNKPVVKKWKELAARNKREKESTSFQDIVMMVDRQNSEKKKEGDPKQTLVNQKLLLRDFPKKDDAFASKIPRRRRQSIHCTDNSPLKQELSKISEASARENLSCGESSSRPDKVRLESIAHSKRNIYRHKLKPLQPSKDAWNTDKSKKPNSKQNKNKEK